MKKVILKFKKIFLLLIISVFFFLTIFTVLKEIPLIRQVSASIICDEAGCIQIDDAAGVICDETGCISGPEPVIRAPADEAAKQMKEIADAENAQKVSSAKTEQLVGSCGTLQIMCQLALLIELFVDKLMSLPFMIAETLFGYTVQQNLLSFGGTNQAEILYAGSIGWRVTRDVANMFFVFFLLWIAIATIFGQEQYGIKQLLPKLIIAALLINFSLPIAQVVINTSSSLAGVFKQGFDAQGGIGATFSKIGINPVAVGKKMGDLENPGDFVQNENKQLQANTIAEKNTEIGLDAAGNPITITGECSLGQRLFSWEICAAKKLKYYIGMALNSVAAKAVSSAFGWDITKTVLTRVAIKIVVYPIAIFVTFAASIILLVRLIALTFIVILGPLAFLLMILPQTQRYYNQWWDSLIKWSFFFPAFMFFMWLGVNVISGVTARRGESVPALIINLFIGIGFLIGSLIVSQQLGVAFAGTAMNMGKRWTVGMRRAATRAGLRGGARAAGTVARPVMETKAMQWLAAKPILKQMTRPFEAATRAKEGVDAERAKALQQAMKTSPASYAAARFKGERAKVQEAYLKSAGEQDIQKLEKGLGKEGMSKIINQVAATSPGLEKRISSAVKDVDLKVAASKNIDVTHADFGRAREEYLDELTVGELRNVLTPENIKNNGVQEYMKKNFGDRELQALISSGEQVRALTDVFHSYAEEEISNGTQLGTSIESLRNQLSQLGWSDEAAKNQATSEYLGDILNSKGYQQNAVNWANAAPIKVVFKEGRPISKRGDDMEEIRNFLNRMSQQQPGGTPPTGGTTP